MWLCLLPRLCCIVSALALVQAVRVVQDDFINPSLPDESVTIKAGSQFTIQWTGQLFTWFAQYAPSANVSNVDLVVKAIDYPSYKHLIQAAVDVTTTRSIAWTASLPDNELSDTPYYSFQFIPAGTLETGAKGQQISSPHVVIRAAPMAGESSMISSLTRVATTPTPALTTMTPTFTSVESRSTVVNATGGSSTTSPNTSLPSETGSKALPQAAGATTSGLSSGAIAGIVIGVVLGVALIVSVTWFVATRSRRQPAENSTAATSGMHDGYSGPNNGLPEYYAQKPSPTTPSDGGSGPPVYKSYQIYAELPDVNDRRPQLP